MKSTKSFIKYNTLMRVISAIVAAVLIIDFLPINLDCKSVSAATLPTLNVAEKWKNMMEQLGWINLDNSGNYQSSNPSMWKDTSLIESINGNLVKDNRYQGSVSTEAPEYELKFDSVYDGWYRVYKVSTGAQLAYVMKNYTSNFDGKLKVNVEDLAKVGETNKICNKLGIELLCDIDLGGEDGIGWINSRNISVLLELDGQGHHLYNCLLNGSNYFLSADNLFIIKNLTFSNVLINHAGGMFGTSTRCMFYNVDWEKCVAPSGSDSTTIVFGTNYNYCYLKECTIRNSYVRGKGHSSLFGSWNDSNVFSSTKTYIGDVLAKDTDSVYHDSIPCLADDIPDYEEIERCFLGHTLVWNDYNGKKHTNRRIPQYPSIYEECSTIGCYLYILSGNHSGGFVSCLQSYEKFDGCSSNTVIFGDTQLGVFIGAVIGSGDGFYLPDPQTGEKILVNSMFNNCYASGSIEGKSKIGGFIGMIFDDARARSAYRGQAVFNNCYSTSSVGMEYSGDYVGGFAGYSVSNYASADSNSYSHIYYNCYVAGEVGGITTETANTSNNNNSIGGFFGSYYQPKSYYKLVNCYYDMQTTGMRERAIGCYGNIQLYNTLEGLYGVYTKKSDKKGVTGLVDNAELGDGYIRISNQMYPMLSGFNKIPQKTDDYNSNPISAMKYEREEERYRNSLSSVSTVLLNHYDTILDENGLEREATASEEDKKIYDTVRDITSKFELTTDDEKGITWGKDVEMNETRNLTDKFGGEDGFTLSYVTVNQNENGEYLNGSENESIVTKKFTPNVLTIGRYDDPEDDRGYYYKCFDFAPGIQWLKVSAGEVQSDTTGRLEEPQYKEGAIIGSRSFRLLPTAYLNAGDIMHINVKTDNTSENVIYSNTVTISEGGNENQINGLFNHSVGTAFAITDRFRMGTDIYSNQRISLYNGKKQTENSTFAFYAGYSVNDANSGNAIHDVVKSKKIGANPMVSQKFDITNNANVTSNLVSLNGVTNNSSDGMVRVRVFRAQPKKIGNSNDFYLERGDEIDYSDNETLAKWQGEKPFDTNDSNAYYYLDYYWRLNDGRYLFDRKLVRITADTYSVTMKTGILDEEFTVNEESPQKTVVDQYVTDKITTNSDQTKTWDKDNLYPSKKAEFSAESASGFYDSYNNKEHINGNDYYTKMLKIDTSSPQTAIGWLRESDYKLTALIVEAVDGTGTRHEMSRIDTNNVAEPLNFDNAEYTYDYKTYSVTQNSETKIFSVVENQTVTNTFNVESYSSSMTNSISKYILFSFSTTGDVSQGGFSTINDDLIITALFRKNDANVKTEKQVLANTDNNPVEKVNETVKNEEYINNGETVTQIYYSSLDSIDEEKRVDDTGVSGDENRKAVLGGDILTYRLKVYNTGYFTSKDVNVYDVIPEGTEYVADSAKLYRQKSLSTSNFDRYEKLEDLTIGDSGFNITYDDEENAIKAALSKVALDENYYIEYKVKVNDIKATELKETITNQADYKFINFNGDTTEDFNDKNTNTAQENAIVSMDASHDENTYIVTFKGETGKMDLQKTYSIDSYYNEFPEQFEYDASNGIQLLKVLSQNNEEDITNKVMIEERDINGKKIGFEIKNKDGESEINLASGTMYKVVFKGGIDPPLTDSSGEIRNKATVTYKEDGETKATAISIVERMTNQTETDVTHLYLSIVKEISQEDPSQTFLFKIERFDDDKLSGTPDISYARINCTEKKQVENMDSDCYIGNSLLQVDKRGYYRITEIDDWGSSDYVFENISVTDMTKITGWSNLDIKSINVESKNAIIRLPRQSDVATLTFPTAYGTFSSGSTAVLYPVVKFTDKPNKYAYRTSQAFAENKIS